MTGPGKRNQPWRLLAPALFFMAWGGNHFTPMLWLYESAGGYQPWQAKLLLGMYVLGLIPGLMFLAPLSDRHGRRKALAFGGLASATGSVLLAVGFESFTVLCCGRIFIGVGVGAAMAVGTTWVKELSGLPYEPVKVVTAGATRASMSLTVGFVAGAGVTGSLTQWGPHPSWVPHVTHAVAMAASTALLIRVPQPDPIVQQPARHRIGVAAVRNREFLAMVVPAAPWVFGAAGVAYAIMPSVVAGRLGAHVTVYATVLSVVTLGVGSIVQTVVPRLELRTGGRTLAYGMALMAFAMLVAVAAAWLTDPWLASVAAVLLGAAYGLIVVAGLIRVQRIAPPQELAGLTAVYYALAYSGYLLPALLAGLTGVASYPVLLGGVAAVCCACAVQVALATRRNPRSAAARRADTLLVGPPDTR